MASADQPHLTGDSDDNVPSGQSLLFINATPEDDPAAAPSQPLRESPPGAAAAAAPVAPTAAAPQADPAPPPAKVPRGRAVVPEGRGRRWPRLTGKGGRKVVVEYLPDADEIERSPVPRYAQFTVHLLLVLLVAFVVWAAVSRVEQVVVARG